MLTKYIEEAMKRARYEVMEDGAFWGEIPGFQGLWGSGPTLEACREDLCGALQGWLILKLWDHDDDVPVLGKLDLYPKATGKAKTNETGVPSRTRKAS